MRWIKQCRTILKLGVNNARAITGIIFLSFVQWFIKKLQEIWGHHHLGGAQLSKLYMRRVIVKIELIMSAVFFDCLHHCRCTSKPLIHRLRHHLLEMFESAIPRELWIYSLAFNIHSTHAIKADSWRWVYLCFKGKRNWNVSAIGEKEAQHDLAFMRIQ